MKKVKKITAIIGLASLVLVGCSKEGPTGPQGETGSQGASGPQAKTFNYTLTFDPGETFETYNGITGFDGDDVVLTFVKYETISGTGYWSQIPIIVGTINYIPEFSETTGQLFINTVKADGSSGSPWSSSTNLAFKSVLVKSSARIKYPDLESKSYEEIKVLLKLD